MLIIIINLSKNVDCQSYCCHHQSRLLHRCDQGSLICWCPVIPGVPVLVNGLCRECRLLWLAFQDLDHRQEEQILQYLHPVPPVYKSKLAKIIGHFLYYSNKTTHKYWQANHKWTHFNREDFYCSLKC